MSIPKPVRIKLSRTSGFNLLAVSLAINGRAAVNVARPSCFGNPFKVSQDPMQLPFIIAKRMTELDGPLTQGQAVEAFRLWLEHHYDGRRMAERAAELIRGRNVACWCKVYCCPTCGEEYADDVPPGARCLTCDVELVRQPCHGDVLLELANVSPRKP